MSNPTPPYGGANYSALNFPRPLAYPFYSASNDGICNTYLPNDSTLNRCDGLSYTVPTFWSLIAHEAGKTPVSSCLSSDAIAS